MRFSGPVAVTFASNAVPLLLVLAVIPGLARELDKATFGFFMVGWSSLGFTSLLDFGLGRTIAHYAARASSGDARTFGPLCQAAFVLLAALGVALCAALLGVHSVARFFFADWAETAGAVRLLILCVPFAVLTAGARGALEGAAEFNAAAGARVIAAFLLIGIPAGAAHFHPTLTAIASGFLAARVLATLVTLAFERRHAGLLKWPTGTPVRSGRFRSVIGYSAWVGTSNLLGSLLAYVDRIVLSLSSLVQVAVYAPPFELASRLLMIPGAIVTVLFTAFSRLERSTGEARAILGRGYRSCFVWMVPPLAVLAAFPAEILGLWLGESYRPEQQAIARYICAGVLLNGLGHVPVAALQGLGSPRLVTQVHLAEILPTGFLFYWLVSVGGATGAAQAWAIRAAADLMLMHLALLYTLRRVERMSQPA
jgi:O-antigen/teichoic acid export membrane protein